MEKKESNLNISSNLMIDNVDDDIKHRYYPGDFLAQLYPSLVDSRGLNKELTQTQIEEYKRYIPCLICNKSCAGTCESSES